MSFSIRRVSDSDRRRSFPWKRIPFFLLAAGRPLASVYVAWQQRRAEEARTRRVVITAAVSVLLALLCAAALWLGVTKAWGALRSFSIKTVFSIAAEDLPVDAYGHTNILLLGQGGVSGEDLTDTIMIASLDEHNGNAVLLSIPRDLYLLHPGTVEPGKINRVYRDKKAANIRAGMEHAAASIAALRSLGDEVETAFNVTIHGIMKIDFDGVVKGVDAIGGVDVDVPQDIVDTEYPTDDYRYETFTIQAGPQHLDGATALKYARSRHSTSDFDRSSRQQQLLSAIAHTVKEQNLLKKAQTVLALQDIAKQHLETTLSMGEIFGLAQSAAHISRENIFTMQLSDRNGLYGEIVEPGGFLYTPPRDLFDGASVLLPVSIPEFPVTWKQLHMLVHMLLDVRSPYLARPGIAILNAGAPAGTASRLSTELTRYGFTVKRAANASIGKLATSLVAPHLEENHDSAAFFADFLQAPLGTLPLELRPEEQADVVLLLGKDYRFTPFQSLSLPE